MIEVLLSGAYKSADKYLFFNNEDELIKHCFDGYNNEEGCLENLENALEILEMNYNIVIIKG